MTDLRIKTAVGPTILLQSGAYFDLLDPANSAFTIEDIAHGLSMTCRFAGQCRQFYSVAEHSWHASRLVAPEFKLRALMHDAAEAFIGDVTRPLKSILPEYKAIERTVETAIMDRFQTGDWNVDEVKRADMMMLHAEQAELMPHHPDRWTTSEGLADDRIVNFRLWSPAEARGAFLLRYAQLTRAPRLVSESTKSVLASVDDDLGNDWFGDHDIAFASARPDHVPDAGKMVEIRRNPDDREWDWCPRCKTGSLDTGAECDSCGFDAQPLVHLQEVCERRGDRMHPSGLYSGEIDSPILAPAFTSRTTEGDISESTKTGGQG